MICGFVRYSNYTWKSMFEPKHTSSRGSVIINRRISQIGAAPMDDFNRSISSREPFSASAKLPTNFQRPKSKYKKSIYNNAVSIYVSDTLIFWYIGIDKSLNKCFILIEIQCFSVVICYFWDFEKIDQSINQFFSFIKCYIIAYLLNSLWDLNFLSKN